MSGRGRTAHLKLIGSLRSLNARCLFGLSVQVSVIAGLARFNSFKLDVWQDPNVRLLAFALLVCRCRVRWGDRLDVEHAVKAGGRHVVLPLVVRYTTTEAKKVEGPSIGVRRSVCALVGEEQSTRDKQKGKGYMKAWGNTRGVDTAKGGSQ